MNVLLSNPPAAVMAKPETATPIPIALIHGQLSHGGSERQLYYFLQCCDRRVWSPHLFVAGEMGVWEEPIRALQIPLTLLTGTPLHKLWRFRRASQHLGAGLVLSWGAYTNAYGVAMGGTGIPVIGSFRNATFADLPARGRRFWRWLSLAGINAAICNSVETLDALAPQLSGHQQLYYVPNGVERFADRGNQRLRWRRALGLTHSDLLVVGVGRLTAQKNFTRFVDAVILANRQSPVHAVIAGPDMGEGAALQRRIDAGELPADRIRLLGPVPDARSLIAAADVFMLTSDYEGMPNVVLEAMAAGVPVISTQVNGIDTLLRKDVEGIVTPHRVDALATALLTLARQPLLRRRMGVAARAKAANFAPEVVYPPLWALCRTMIVPLLHPSPGH